MIHLSSWKTFSTQGKDATLVFHHEVEPSSGNFQTMEVSLIEVCVGKKEKRQGN